MYFNEVLSDWNHEIWKDLKDSFKNEQHFHLYIKHLTMEDKVTVFEILWSHTIAQIEKKRLDEKNLRRELKWSSLLNKVTNKPQYQIISEFEYEIQQWKKNWCNDNWWTFSLDLAYNKKKNLIEFKKLYSNTSPIDKIYKKDKKQVFKIKWWNKDNWSKRF